MNTKPRTTWQCRWVPRRSARREFTAQDAARITCKAIENGATRGDIDRRIELTCPGKGGRQPVDAALAAAAQAVSLSNMEVLNDSYQLFLTINAVLIALLALPVILRRSPGLIVAFRAAARVQRSVGAQVTVLGRQIAANESLYTQATIALRRAA